MAVLMWFREHDLRCLDNTALYYAAETGKHENGCLALFIISPEEWRAHDMAPVRIDFIFRQLKLLQADLLKLHIPLIILNNTKNTPKLLLDFIQENNIKKLFYNTQYEINEARRDQKVNKLLAENNIAVHSYTDQVILAPGDVRTQEGNFYTIFTPFKKAWLEKLKEKGGLTVLPMPPKQIAEIRPKINNTALTADARFAHLAQLWPAGESSAHERLNYFIQKNLQDYAHTRDFPALNTTSGLSPYLTSGIVSPRQCLSACFSAVKKNPALTKGADVWISELIWREFYKHILFAFPRVSMNRAFKLKTEKLHWENNPEHFEAWKEGRTGIPIVDAAMRQLKQTGWMHNRLRMLTAMFLSKHLFIDWRLGEKYFMQNLIDGDLAANNGGWQWSASTGTDAVPYFRLFNPLTQSAKFDNDGTFIRQYCPELQKLSAKEIHDPTKLPPLLRATLDYPAPIIDLAFARTRILSAFKKIQ